ASLRRALDTADRLGFEALSVGARHNLGLALLEQGRLQEACALERDAADRAAARGQPRVEMISRAYLARGLLQQNDLEGAEREARRALEQTVSAPRPYPRAVLAEVLLARGDASAAREVASEAMREVRAAGGADDGEVFVRLIDAKTLLFTGDRDAAANAVREAREELERRAARIDDPELRKSFFEGLRDNAETVALARELGV